jgi:hypothetical protein
MAPVQLFPLDWNMQDFPQRLRQLRKRPAVTVLRRPPFLS